MSDLLGDAAKRLAGAGIASPRREARLLLSFILDVPADALLTSPALESDAERRYQSVIERRMAHEPLAYITGKKEFWSISFHVAPGVLIPRPDSETLIEQLCRAFPVRNAPLSILDLGTGSGCLLIAALSEYPRAKGLGIDSSDAALAIARRNAAGLDRAEIRKADFGEVEGQFDVILSNPPYIPTADIAGLERDVRDYEPMAALDGGADGLDAYRQLAGLLPRLLAKGGQAFLEIGVGQERSVPAVMEAAGLEITRVTADLAGVPRCVQVALRAET